MIRRVTKLERQIEKLASHLGLYWKTDCDKDVPRWEKSMWTSPDSSDVVASLDFTTNTSTAKVKKGKKGRKK